MKLLIAGLFLVLAFGGFTEASARQSQQVSVKINHEKKTARGNVRIKFLEMVEDSRCPKDAQCIWAGNAKIKVQISKPGGTPKIFELNSSVEPQIILIGGYKIRLIALTPEPDSNIRIRKDGYVATFTISR